MVSKLAGLTLVDVCMSHTPGQCDITHINKNATNVCSHIATDLIIR
jgi:hypothetical protein